MLDERGIEWGKPSDAYWILLGGTPVSDFVTIVGDVVIEETTDGLLVVENVTPAQAVAAITAPQETSGDELQPCPFCGGKAHLFVESDNDNPFASNDECNYYWQVKHNCNMSDDANHYFIDSDFLCFRTPWFKDRQKAIDVWNRRV